ncbi:antA/AntB antirepressor family protein [uncultured Fusobacterium sp.]|uniref:antA/AntB antirepressor family protein n=1 Tax=uncultured Fusobacterium sp. TaxID=159267 RepID=UPI0025E25F53|nr:antA/AntB antirepressor family protein [uncultured Fusobacterium sp.]
MNVLIEQNSQYGLVVSSRVVAKELGKQHKNVLRDIEQILSSSNLSQLIFESSYKAKTGTYKEYLLTKDGFTLYMFNIQGYQDFKMAYIQKFNEMEKELKNLKSNSSLLPTSSIRQTKTKKNELIKIETNINGEKIVSAWELWKFLDISYSFSTWIKRRIEKYDFIENEDFVVVTSTGVKLGNPQEDYILSLDMAKELAIIEKSPAGRVARRYFIQCEKKYRKLLDEKHSKEIQALQENDSSEFYLKKIEALENNYQEVQKFIKELYEESELLKVTMQKFNSRCTWLSLLAGQGERLICESKAEKKKLNQLKIVG